MRLSSLLTCASLLAMLPALPARAEDNKIRVSGDKAKEVLDKLVGEARKAAVKLHDDEKHGTLWPRSKETLGLAKDEYLKRVESALKSMDAEIKALAESESVVNARDYFKAHLESLKLHLAYSRQDADKLKASDSEESFRVKQKKFDRTLGFLADNIQLAKDEAGL